MSERPTASTIQTPENRLAVLRGQRKKVEGLISRGILGPGHLAAVDDRLRQLEALSEAPAVFTQPVTLETAEREIVVLANGGRGRRFTPAGSKESVVLGLKEWEVVSGLPYLPQVVSGPDLREMFFGEQIRDGEIARKRGRVLIHSFIKHLNSKLSPIGWIVFNTRRGKIDEQKGGFADARWGLVRIDQLSEADREVLGFPISVPVVVNGDRVYIGPKQANLLRFLVSNPGKDMTSRELSLGAFGESDHRKAHSKDFWSRLKKHFASFPVLSLSTSGLANVHRKFRLDIAGGVKVVKIGEEEIRL